MRGEDRLPVLAFPRPPAPQPRRTSDDLAHAIAALQGAMQVELHRAQRRRAVADMPSTDQSHEDDPFSPVGVPRPRPTPGIPETPGVQSGGTVTRPGADRDATARRILSLHLPQFAMERFQRLAARRHAALPEDVPQVLVVEGPHGPVIHAINRAAGLAGAHVGARVVDMRALCPDLKVEYADLRGDRAALEKLMLWARRWCPWTAVDGPSGLIMDTTGSDHLWGGEPGMLREIEARLSTLGLSASLAIAPTQGAAWALARFGGVRECCLPAGLAARIAPLPVRALRLDGDTVLLLQRLGLKTIGDLAGVPRISLARRFSRAALPANPLLRLDQMMGRLAEPISSPDDPPRFAAAARLAEPVLDPAPHLPGLCAALCASLAAAGFGARQVTLTVFRVDGEVAFAAATTSQPNRDAGHLLRLFDGRLDRIDPGFGFDLITLAATVAERMDIRQARLDGGADDAAGLARLIDRLSGRYGAKALTRPVPRMSHIPERRAVWAPAMAVSDPPAPARPRIPRPVRLFDHPEEVHVVYAVPEGPPAQFIWRRVTHRVTRFAGPERIAPEWWADKPGTRLRDYYRIEDHSGRRFWIYRDGVLGDGRGQVPRWFVHGVFG
jgi:protein ImuB